MTLDNKIHHANEIANAIQRRQLFYTMQDAIPKEHIKLPTPQTCGTMTQQRSYAMGKAMTLIEEYSKTN